MNVDRAYAYNTGATGCGGVLKKMDMTVIEEFMCGLVSSDRLRNYGVVYGYYCVLVIWLPSGSSLLRLDGDCQVMCAEPHNILHADKQLTSMIHEFQQRDWVLKVHRISRWRNCEADFLAKRALSMGLRIQICSSTTFSDLMLENGVT